MIGTDRADQPVLRQRRVLRLDQFLQRRLVVLPGRAEAGVGDERRELAGDEGPHVFDTAIEINRRNERFVAVGEERLLLTAAGFFLAPAKQQMLAQAQTVGEPRERCRGHQRRLDLRLLAFVVFGKFSEQQVRVAQEFERLVVADASADVLVRAGRVGHGVLEQSAVAEAIADGSLQRLEFVAEPDNLAGLTAPELGTVALDDAPRLVGVVCMNGDANLAERADGHGEQRLRQVRCDD